MKNKLSDLNNYLFEQIERLQDDSLDAEAVDREMKKADAIVDVAEVIVKSSSLQLQALSKFSEYGIIGQEQVKHFLAPTDANKAPRQIEVKKNA